MKRTDLAYLAGLVDGEGYIGIKKSKAYKCQGRQTPGYTVRLQVRMVDEPAIKFLAETLGGWYYKEKPHCAKGRPLFCYQVSNKAAESVVRCLLPFLRVKKANAEAALSLRALQADSKKHKTKVTGYRNFPNRHGTPRRVANHCFSDEYVEMCDALYRRCKELNATGV